jgi:hypothetical protein
LTRVVEVYVAAVAPAIGFAPENHWYVGAIPPLLGRAVNVTDVPAQIAPTGLELIVTDGFTMGFTVNTRLLLVAVGVVLHDKLVVIITETDCPFSGV